MRVEEIRLECDALGRQIGHQHAGDMLQRLHVVDAQDSLIVGNHKILLDGFVVIALGQFGRRIQRHDVGLDGPRLVDQHVLVQELDVLRVLNDGRADVQVRAQSSDVIEVRDES